MRMRRLGRAAPGAPPGGGLGALRLVLMAGLSASGSYYFTARPTRLSRVASGLALAGGRRALAGTMMLLAGSADDAAARLRRLPGRYPTVVGSRAEIKSGTCRGPR